MCVNEHTLVSSLKHVHSPAENLVWTLWFRYVLNSHRKWFYGLCSNIWISSPQFFQSCVGGIIMKSWKVLLMRWRVWCNDSWWAHYSAVCEDSTSIFQSALVFPFFFLSLHFFGQIYDISNPTSTIMVLHDSFPVSGRRCSTQRKCLQDREVGASANLVFPFSYLSLNFSLCQSVLAEYICSWKLLCPLYTSSIFISHRSEWI